MDTVVGRAKTGIADPRALQESTTNFAGQRAKPLGDIVIAFDFVEKISAALQIQTEHDLASVFSEYQGISFHFLQTRNTLGRYANVLILKSEVDRLVPLLTNPAYVVRAPCP